MEEIIASQLNLDGQVLKFIIQKSLSRLIHVNN